VRNSEHTARGDAREARKPRSVECVEGFPRLDEGRGVGL
jgi:hypothetical protein